MRIRNFCYSEAGRLIVHCEDLYLTTYVIKIMIQIEAARTNVNVCALRIILRRLRLSWPVHII